MKIVVAGGTGFIGKLTVQKFSGLVKKVTKTMCIIIFYTFFIALVVSNIFWD